jgi:L-fuconolactonase
VIIDAHQHFWGDEGETRGSAYLPRQYLDDVAPVAGALRASVFVECNTHYDITLPSGLQATGETRFAAHIGGMHADSDIRLAAAVVGFADPFDSGVPFEAVLDAHLAAASGRLRAIRRCAAWDEDETLNYPILKTRQGMLRDARLRDALRTLAARDLMFETWIYHTQLEEFAELAGAAPECTIILDHAGMPLAKGRFADAADSETIWRHSIERLADRSNVHVKIGGLITPGTTVDAVLAQRGLTRWTAAALAEALSPYLEHLVRCFGPGRCLFESNFPVDRRCCEFPTLIEAYSLALGGISADGRAAIFAGNASRLYRIPLGGATGQRSLSNPETVATRERPHHSSTGGD